MLKSLLIYSALLLAPAFVKADEATDGILLQAAQFYEDTLLWFYITNADNPNLGGLNDPNSPIIINSVGPLTYQSSSKPQQTFFDLTGEELGNCIVGFVPAVNPTDFMTQAWALQMIIEGAYAGGQGLVENSLVKTAFAQLGHVHARQTSFVSGLWIADTPNVPVSYVGSVPENSFLTNFDTPLGQWAAISYIQNHILGAECFLFETPGSEVASTFPPLYLLGTNTVIPLGYEAFYMNADSNGSTLAVVEPGSEISLATVRSADGMDLGVSVDANYCLFTYGNEVLFTDIILGIDPSNPTCSTPTIPGNYFVFLTVDSTYDVNLSDPANILAGPAVLIISTLPPL